MAGIDVKSTYKENRILNSSNMHQGDFKRVLCVCSAGLLRSPTAALVLSQPPFNFNTRAAGLVPHYALIPVDEVLLAWAEEIVCMEQNHADLLSGMTDKKVICLNIPDRFPYRSADLVSMISKNYMEIAKGE